MSIPSVERAGRWLHFEFERCRIATVVGADSDASLASPDPGDEAVEQRDVGHIDEPHGGRPKRCPRQLRFRAVNY
jgi:hypothetical protein